MDDKMNDEAPFVTTLAHAAADPFRLLVEAVKDYGIFMLDPAGNVSSWNSGAAQIHGYKAEEVIGQHVSSSTPPTTWRRASHSEDCRSHWKRVASRKRGCG